MNLVQGNDVGQDGVVIERCDFRVLDWKVSGSCSACVRYV